VDVDFNVSAARAPISAALCAQTTQDPRLITPVIIHPMRSQKDFIMDRKTREGRD
jgi:hypothetical protein